MSEKRALKVKRRRDRRRKRVSPHLTRTNRDAQALAELARLTDTRILSREELLYTYSDDDHPWLIAPVAGEWFDLPLTDELESFWERLDTEFASYAKMLPRIRELRSQGRASVPAMLPEVFWQPLLPDGSTIGLVADPPYGGEPDELVCPELTGDDEPIWIGACDLGLERFSGQVATPEWHPDEAEPGTPYSLARQPGKPWPDGFTVKRYIELGESPSLASLASYTGSYVDSDPICPPLG